MLNSTFDPYDILEQLKQAVQQLNDNILVIDRNLHASIRAHNGLSEHVRELDIKIKEQGEVIDILTQGLNAANKANEIMMKDLLSNLTDKIKEVK
jgi:hypothetical protein